MDNAAVYLQTRTRLLDLAGSTDETAAARPVPACPGWTVKDTFAHLTGGCADVLDGRLDGAGSPAWTGRQVAERGGLDLGKVCAEWAERGVYLDEWLEANGTERTQFLAIDVWTHEQDIREPLGVSRMDGDRRVDYLVERALPVFDRRFTEAGAPALRVVVDGAEQVLGSGAPEATLESDAYELMRILFGRRSQAQIERASWDGSPAPYLDHLHLFELPAVDLAD
jgi:uncharacterized protein (TIGR03083 family)